MTIPTPDEICERLERKIASTGAWMTSDVQAFYIDIRALIQQQHATIERLSAALEHLIDIIDGTETTGFDPHVEQMLMDAAETGRTALGKDASDDRSPGSSEGE